jgi:hypothetical protein
VENVEIKVEGNTLVIRVPNLMAPGSLSESKKTKLIASTRGAQLIEHPKRQGIKVALNVTVPPTA